MNYCPKCRKKLVVQDFCVECGADLREYLEKAEGNSSSGMGGFDFSSLENEAKKQLDEKNEFDIENGVLKYYRGNSADVVIPLSVNAIGDGAFRCREIRSVSIHSGVTYIGNSAFYECKNLRSVTLSEGITEIRSYAFHNCTSLVDVTIPDSVTRIEGNAFSSCTGLKSINIPRNATFIEQYAFGDCIALEKIYFGATSMRSMEKGSRKGFSFSAYLFASGGSSSTDEETEYSGYTNNVFENAGTASPGVTVTIGSNVTMIPHGIFHSYGCNVTKVIFESGSNCDSIGNYAFYDCVSLRDCRLPESISSIGEYAFSGCERLNRINLPERINAIGKRAFGNCTGLAEISLPSRLRIVEPETFIACSGLRSVTIPEGVNVIGEMAFQSCTALTSIDLPSTVNEIQYWAFWGCNNMRTVRAPKRVAGHFYGYEYVTRDIIGY